MKRSIWAFDWRVRNKQNSISYSNVSRVRMYGKLRLNVWHKAINNIKISSGCSPIKERQGGTFLPLCLRRVMQGHSFWMAVRLNAGLGVRFLYPTLDDCALGQLVQRFYWLINQSYVFRGLDPHKIRFWKGNQKIESWFRRQKTWSSCHPLRHHCHFTQSPQQISLFKTDSGLAAIASQLITELKALVVIVVHDSFFLSLYNE